MLRQLGEWIGSHIELFILIPIAMTFVAFIVLAMFYPDKLDEYSNYSESEIYSQPIVWEKRNYSGIDVSEAQGKVKWDYVACDRNIQFVYLRATEGATVVDKRYAENLAGTRDQGMLAGAYHVFTSQSEPAEQFHNFVGATDSLSQVLLPMVWVLPEKVGTWGKEQLQDKLAEMLKLLANYYKCTPIICTTPQFYAEHLAPRFNSYPLCIRHFDKEKPHLPQGSRCLLWQMTDQGTIQGFRKDKTVCLDAFADSLATIENILVPSKDPDADE